MAVHSMNSMVASVFSDCHIHTVVKNVTLPYLTFGVMLPVDSIQCSDQSGRPMHFPVKPKGKEISQKL